MDLEQRLRLFNVAEIARRMGCSRQLIWNWAQRGWVAEGRREEFSELTGIPVDELSPIGENDESG